MGDWIATDPKGGKLYNPRTYTAAPQGVNFTQGQTEYQLFPEEYFSAADCSVYFNDVWMDELTGLHFKLTEQVSPIFGYASKTWDYFMRGTRLVQGEFRIAFKEAGYMFAILEHIGLQKKKSPALGYLMNGQEVPLWHGQVQQNIEEILSFWHEQGQKMPDKTVVDKIPYTKREKWLYKWPKLKEGKTGKSNSMVMWANKGYNTGESRHGTKDAIKQLQSRLIELGYNWPPITFDWKQHYGGDTWRVGTASGAKSSVNLPNSIFQTKYLKGKISRNSGDWYLCLRYWPDNTVGRLHSSISGYDRFSTFEAQFQKRMDNYPGGLKDFNMGGQWGRYDGRFGSAFVAAIKKFLSLAEYDDGSNGYYVSGWLKKELQKGLTTTGEYDVPTKIAVTAFQAKNGLPQTGYVDYATMYKMAPMHDVTYYKEKERKVAGEIHKDSSLTAESRMVQYEKEIWGRPFVSDAEDVRKTESFFYRGAYMKNDMTDNKEVHTTQWLYQNGIDIYINYGPMAEATVNKYGNSPDREFKNGAWYPKETPADISSSVSFNTTVKAIRNVQIYDVEQILDPNTGQPIEEVYRFFAKDLD